jgi:hypothetical protein
MRTLFATLLVLTVTLGAAERVDADITAFVGANVTPSNRPVRGVAIGMSLLVLGFEFEFSDTSADKIADAPRVRTGMLNLLVQTPFGISGLQFYGTIGAGVFQEVGADLTKVNASGNAGGGVKVSVAGPLRMRMDYRLFRLRGTPQQKMHQRIYAGLNLGF